MGELRLRELAEATGGALLRGDPEAVVDSYVIDTRRLRHRGVFFALRGSKTDGHRFLGEAAHNRAVAAVIEREPETDQRTPDALIRVDSTETALGRCGSWVRRKRNDMKWIAITGSNGKTTTRELLAEGLSGQFRVHRTPGNLNNHLGVPLSLLSTPDDAEIGVLELAMSAAGEIAHLAQMVDPDVGMVTNVRAAHLAQFDSLDDIAAAKGELFAVMRSEATAAVNLDDVHVRVQAARHDGPRVTFGSHAEADLGLEGFQGQFVPGAALAFHYDSREYKVQLQIGGGHTAFNALAAMAGIVAAGGDLDSAIPRMQQVQAGPGRGKVHRLANDVLLVDDSYNCSPSALASVLDSLRYSDPTGRRVLFLGDMLELGPLQGALHREAGRRAAAAGVGLLITVGTESQATSDEARHHGVGEAHHYSNSREAAEVAAEMLEPGDLIVVKGSRSMRMERVVHALVGQPEERR